MTQETKRKQAVMYTSWVVPVAVAGVVAAAVISYLRTVEPQAAPGSPYYTKAVKEAAAGLANPGLEAVPDGRPALPAGYSPEDVAWCEQCKAYHKRQPAQAGPGGRDPVAPALPPPAAPNPAPSQ